MRFGQRQYTLIELVLVLAIMVLAVAAVTAGAATGVRVFRRAHEYSTVQTDLFLAVERMERDLRGTFHFSGIPFEGQGTWLSFPGLVPLRQSDFQNSYALIPGRLTYEVNAQSGELSLARAAFPKLGGDRERDQGEQVNLGRSAGMLTFSYLQVDPETRQHRWRPEWTAESGVPQAVRLTFIPDRNADEIGFERIVFIPAAGQTRD